jgi:peptidoglycan/LPS O-acetylase OafA/YrhL
MVGIGFGPMGFKELIIGLITYENYYTEHLWFLYVLFVFFVVNILLGKYGDEWWLVPLAVILGAATSYVTFPHIIERCMVWLSFFIFGRYIAANKKLENFVNSIKSGRGFMAVLAGFFVLSAIRVIMINRGINVIAGFLIKETIGFLGVWIIYGIAIRVSGKLSEMITQIGNYSYEIYLMHNPYCVALSAVVLNKMMGIPAFISIMIATFLGVSLPMLASIFVIRKSKLLSIVMIGK